ncbi:hypothetical protein CTAYLR_003719 [Chrysophaeum taylorii]|uniref:Uncharacterized protein n=1 Tax=Chrysophaeum taylorii TaxID=2483200 RepID=A0AAD7UMC3_9STRA|nr:hypothetical protein CTAYLR_003719 [Chrysophaeum taylorii]
MRGAGCTINDMLDRDVDARVARTRARPLAAGDLEVWPDATIFLGAQLSVGLAVLLNLNVDAIFFGALSLPLVATYPLAKRYNPIPQLHLGLAFNWGALLGYYAAAGTLEPAVALPLYAGCISWTLVYDTLYAHQDKRDDEKLGLRSSALALGDALTKPACAVWSVLALAGVGLAGHNADLPHAWPFHAGLAAFGAHLAWQVKTADLDDPSNLAARFKSNAYVAPVVLAGIAAANLTVPPPPQGVFACCL